MKRSTLRAGAAGLLSISLLGSVATAESSLDAAVFVETQRGAGAGKFATYPKPDLSGETTYKDVLKAAENHPNVYIGETWITELLNDKSLTPKQHARVLYARAQHRWKKSSNKVGAWQDFTKFTELYPEDIYARNAGIEAGYVNTEIGYINARMEHLQTLSDWFDDSWQLGKRAEAAARYKRSGFVPEPEELKVLQAAGYVCESGVRGAPSGYNPVSSDASNLHWCE